MLSMELQEVARHVRDALADPCTAPLHTGDPDLDVALTAVRQPRRDKEARNALLCPFWTRVGTSAHVDSR